MARRKRRRRARKSKLLAALILLAALVWVVQRALLFAAKPEGKLTLIAVGVMLVVLAVVRFKRGRTRRARMAAVAISTNPRDYIITPSDYKRGSPKESHYRKIMQLTLLATFGNRCAKCGVDDNGLDLDHFFLPKNEGGSFIMRHRDGYLINNAVPLCASCNRRKSDRPFTEFFDENERLRIFRLNVALTQRLNRRRLLDADGNVRPETRRTSGVRPAG